MIQVRKEIRSPNGRSSPYRINPPKYNTYNVEAASPSISYGSLEAGRVGEKKDGDRYVSAGSSVNTGYGKYASGAISSSVGAGVGSGFGGVTYGANNQTAEGTGTPSTDTVNKPFDKNEEKTEGASTSNAKSAQEELAESTLKTEVDEAYATEAEAKKNAAERYQRDVVDANTSYQKYNSKYGANAEAMAEAGLQNSGYADYHRSVGYGQMRDDIQSAKGVKYSSDANAEANRAQAVRDANYKYDSTMLGIEQNRDNAYLSVLDGVSNGTMTEEIASAVADRYGFSEADRKAIQVVSQTWKDTKASADIETAKNNIIELAMSGASEALIRAIGGALNLSEENMASALAISAANTADGQKTSEEYYEVNLPQSVSELDTLIKQKKISEVSRALFVEKIQNKNYNEYMNEVSLYGISTNSDVIMRAYEQGDLSQKQFEDLQRAWSSQINVGTNTFKYDDGSTVSAADGCDIVRSIICNPLCSEGTAISLLRSLESTIGMCKAASEYFGYFMKKTGQTADGEIIYQVGQTKVILDTYEHWASFIRSPEKYLKK